MLSDASFGFLTLATRADYLKAIGLSLSLEVSNPGVPRAVACSEDLFPLLEHYFDFLVPEVKGLKGFAHKVYLDVYTPFSKTMFLTLMSWCFSALRSILRRGRCSHIMHVVNGLPTGSVRLAWTGRKWPSDWEFQNWCASMELGMPILINWKVFPFLSAQDISQRNMMNLEMAPSMPMKMLSIWS